MEIEEWENIVSDFDELCEESLTKDKSYENYIFDTETLPHPKNKILESGILALSKYLGSKEKDIEKCINLVKNLFKLSYYQNGVGYRPFPLKDDRDLNSLRDKLTKNELDPESATHMFPIIMEHLDDFELKKEESPLFKKRIELDDEYTNKLSSDHKEIAEKIRLLIRKICDSEIQNLKKESQPEFFGLTNSAVNSIEEKIFNFENRFGTAKGYRSILCLLIAGLLAWLSGKLFIVTFFFSIIILANIAYFSRGLFKYWFLTKKVNQIENFKKYEAYKNKIKDYEGKELEIKNLNSSIIIPFKAYFEAIIEH
jgi:hypothetical protein